MTIVPTSMPDKIWSRICDCVEETLEEIMRINTMIRARVRREEVIRTINSPICIVDKNNLDEPLPISREDDD